MRISFWLTTPVDLTHGINRPMGGAEISAVQLADELALRGHSVCIFCNTKKPFFPHEDINMLLAPYDEVWCTKHDIFICVRAFEILNPRIGKYFQQWPNKVCNWSGDAFDQPCNEIFWDRLVCDNLDTFVCKSQWQMQELTQRFPMLQDKCCVIRNGLAEEHFRDLPDRTAASFVYASTVYRGVTHFIKLWPKIKQALPDATLKLYAKTTLYLDNNPRDKEFTYVYDVLNNLQDVELCDPIPQHELIKVLASSTALLYPNDYFVESSCGVAQQAIAAGTPVVTSNKAGLPETVGDCGFLIDGDPASDSYQEEFVQKTVELCQNTQLYQTLSSQGKESLNPALWQNVAKVWEGFLESL